MRITHLKPIYLALGLLCDTAWSSNTEPVNHILNASGIAAILPDLTRQMTAGAIRHADRCGAIATTTRRLAASALLDDIGRRLTATTTTTQAQVVSNWYQSKLAQTITELEQQSANEHDLNNFISSKRNNPQWQQRTLPLISEIYENTRAGELNAVIGLEIEYAGLMLSGCIEKIANQDSSQNLPNIEQITARIIRSDKQTMMTLFKNDEIYSLGYSLRSLSIPELTSYTNFTRENSDFYRSLVQSTVTGLKQAADRMISGQTTGAEK